MVKMFMFLNLWLVSFFKLNKWENLDVHSILPKFANSNSPKCPCSCSVVLEFLKLIISQTNRFTNFFVNEKVFILIFSTSSYNLYYEFCNTLYITFTDILSLKCIFMNILLCNICFSMSAARQQIHPSHNCHV